MPLTGGPADKAGNRYEARWTVACMARVMRGEYESVRLEPPGPEGEGIEFWLKRGEVREYHQVKRQGSRQGHWTLHNLDDRILPTFQSHLAADEHAKCVFVSSQDAFELRELAERAKSAKELSEFEREFVEGEWGRRFASLQQIWSVCSPADAFAFLRRIQVRTIDEETLRRHAELELAPLADCDPATAADVLFSYALEAIHQELDAALITERLRCRSIKRPVWSQPTSLFEVIQNANERYINRLRTELIRGELLHRDECATVISMLQENSVERGVIITGAAGAGKSTVQLQVIEKLQQQGTPILAFRIDLLEPTQQPDEAGRQIDLPASPVKTLAALAKGRPCVLIMDQLDAVSMVSGRNPSFFDCFDEMVRQALAVSSIRLVVACRSFDFENDYRLRRLGGRDGLFKNVEVGPLSDEAVRSTVQILGIDAKRLTEKQMQLLRVPAHLRLLSEITHDGMTNLAFQSTNELYGLYWNRKEHVLRARFGSSLSWVPVIDRLCVQMSTNQTLSVPMTVLDDFGSARDALLSEHVLVHDGSRVTFFHEGFFDYAFARRFAAKGEDLMKLLQTGEQHLFRRAQVRQILFQQREMDQLRYLDNLKVLLTSPTVRFHIKQIVFVLLKQFADPFELEWRVLESLLKDTEFPYSNELWFVTRTLPWFRLLDSLGIVKTLLESDEPKTIDATVRLLNGVRREAADRVAELVEPYVGTSNEWRDRHRYLVQLADLSAGQRFFNYFLRLLDNGDLEGMGRFHENDFLGMLYELPKRHADWACEAVGHYLLRELETSLSKGHSNPFRSERGMRSSQLADQILVDCAQRSPGPFVKHVLPFVLRVIELNPAREEEKLWFDEIWCLRHRDEGLSLSDHVLHALDGAIRSLAREKSDQFDAIAANLRRSNYETVQFLLIRGYAANGEKFADEGIGYLCEFPRRLRCGYFDAGYSHHVSCELIEAATPFCAAAHLEMLESILLEY